MTVASLPAGCTIVACGRHQLPLLWWRLVSAQLPGNTVVYVVEDVDPGTEAFIKTELEKAKQQQ